MSKTTDLQDLAGTVHDFAQDDIPTAAVWNINGNVTRDGLNMVGDFFADTDAAAAALSAKYAANHNVDGSHDVTKTAPEWVPEPVAPSWVSASSFSLPFDRRADYRVGDRLRLHQGAGGTSLVTVAIDSIAFTSATGVTTIVVRVAAPGGPVLQSLVSIDRGLVRESFPRIGAFDLLDGLINDPRVFTDGVIPLAKLGPNSVDRTKILDGEVIAGKLGPAAVVSSNIGDGQVTSVKVASSAITTVKLANNAVNASKIITGAIQDFHIADGQVKRQHIADQNIETQHLALQAVDAAQLHVNAVITDRLANGAVTPAKRAPTWYQQPSGNAQVAAVFEQFGWNYFTVAAGQHVWEKPITFPVAFAQLLNVQVQIIGIKTGGADPSSIADSSATRQAIGTSPSGNSVENMVVANVKGGSLAASGFTANAASNSTTPTITDGDRILFTWVARGT